jgi:predicted phage tail protein
MAKPGDQMAAGVVGRGRFLASHSDREQVIDTLKAAFVQGLLTKDEFDSRVGRTLGSRTYAELGAVTADIPGRLIGAQLPPKRAQARAAGNMAVKSGACALTVLILWASTSAAAVSGSDAALIMALFVMGIGVIIAVLAALLTAGIRMLESRDRKRSSGQLPLRSSPGAGGQASRRPASGASAGQFPQVDHGQQHTAGAAQPRHPLGPLAAAL